MTKIPTVADLTIQETNVEHNCWGRIYVQNRHRPDIRSFTSDRIVILQHGATYGSTAFETRLSGLSWMDYLALHGFDVYCIDLPGYGRSERPSIMDEPPEDNLPFMRTRQAADCLLAVIRSVLERRAVDRVNLIGWSWGTAICSYLATHYPDLLERLVLYAPVWDRSESQRSPIHIDGKLGAYRTVSRAATQARRNGGLPESLRGVVMPPEWFDSWWQETASLDRQGKGETIRAPNGVLQDAMEFWNVGKAIYEPSLIKAPLLIVVGEWDNDTPPTMAQALFTLCDRAPWKRFSILSGGTHTMLMERNRLLLFRTVQQFLTEGEPSADAIE